MSDFGMFESDEAAQAKPQVQARLAARKMDAAIDTVRAKFGRFLLGATGIDEFGDRWHYSKHDIRAAVEPYVFPNTGTMRRLQNAMKADWKLAHPYKLALDHDEAGYGQMETDNTRRNQDLDETYHPSSGNLVPKGDFEGWKNSVDQGGPEKVESHAFTPGGDSGSDKHARRRHATDDDNYSSWMSGWADHESDVREREREEAEKDGKKEAARLVADIYTDFARSNGMRVASLDTLDRYASTGIHDADYRLLHALIVQAAEDCDEACDDDDEDTDSEAPSESESDESDSDDDEGEDYDFGGESASEDDDAEDDESDEDGDGDHDDDDHHAEEDEESDEDYDFGGDEGGDEQGGGEQYTVPEQAPELSPEMMGEIPQGDTDGSAPVPPEVIDSLLGLPEGTIEQLLLEEVEQGAQGGGDPGMSGAPMPQGGGDDFFGGGGGDNTEPPRVASRRQAKDYGRKCSECKSNNTDYSSGTNTYDCYDCGATFKPYSNPKKKSPEKESRRRSARSFWAAEGDPEQESEGGGGEEQAAPAQDPAAAMGGGDPAAMGMGQPMMPPPGSQAVTPPAPPAPLENQPAEDALLDTANQAIMQMIDQETAEYQQIIDPLSQALQAIQFAQQVEQTEHPMDVTPPQGTVDVSPAAAPGGAGNPMQQQAMRRQAKVDFALRNAAALIASRYRLSATGHQMLLEATLGRRGYEHVVEALKLVPAEVRKAAALHMSHLFAAGNQRFNRDVFMKTVMASNPRDRAWDAWASGRDRGVAEHGRHDVDDDREYDSYSGAGDPEGRGGPVGYSSGPDTPGGRRIEHSPVHHTHPDPGWRPTYDDVAGDPRFASRGRLPFDRPRLAGETWVPTAVLDAFEHYNQGVPRVDDGNDTNDLPVMPGANPNGKNAASQKAVERFQRWQKSQQQKGLATTQGEAGVHNFLQTRNPIKKRVGPDAQNMIHEHLGLQPDAVKAPKAKPVKAVNPVLKGKGGKTPAAPEAKAPAPKAAPKTASFFTRKVPGWRWDDHLSGYLSKEARAFTCSCGQKIASPSYKTCNCGKVWNVYAIGDTHHLASDTAEVYIAREIPVRPGVIMANRKMAGDPEYRGEPGQFNEGDKVRHLSPTAHGRGGVVHSVHPERGVSVTWNTDFPDISGEPYRSWEHPGDLRKSGRKTAKDGGCTCWEGYERVPGTEPCASKSCRKKTGARAQQSHAELVAMIDKLADWTKYDSPDPTRDPKVKPPSTKIKSQPGDWTNRDFTGPTKGQWREPEPTELPRKTRKKK